MASYISTMRSVNLSAAIVLYMRTEMSWDLYLQAIYKLNGGWSPLGSDES